MSRFQYFKDLKAHIKNNVDNVRFVSRWNNQVARMNEHQAFDCPAIFIGFTPSNFKDTGGGLGIQEMDLLVTLYIVWADFTDEGEKIEEFIEQVYKAIHTFTSPVIGSGKLMRVAEREDFDHDQLQVHEIDFNCHFIDYSADKRGTKRKELTENISVTFD
jgi:hypothetical protein